MLVLMSLLVTLCGLFWINYKTSEKVAPTDRLGLSLLCVGFGTIPVFLWFLFIPNFFFIVLGAVLFLLVPTDQFYERRNSRRRQVEALRAAAAQTVAAGGVPIGLCPSCEEVLPIDSQECPRCHATFSQDARWRVQVP